MLNYILIHNRSLAFHVSYIDHDGNGVLFIASSGKGKSTQRSCGVSAAVPCAQRRQSGCHLAGMTHDSRCALLRWQRYLRKLLSAHESGGHPVSGVGK